jgi:glucose dehydrogenase
MPLSAETGGPSPDQQRSPLLVPADRTRHIQEHLSQGDGRHDVHWLGTCLRFVPDDFRLRTAHGRGLDWPISYDELEPFHSDAEHEIGVAGDSGETFGSPRSRAYPMPAIPQTFLDRVYARALAAPSSSFASRRRPAILSIAMGDRPAAAARAAS